MGRIHWAKSRQRAQIEFCIDAFVEETRYVPAGARRAQSPEELSPRLEHWVACMAEPSAWRAWLDGARGWFVEGRLADESVVETDQPTVHLIFRDHDARSVAAGVWCRRAPARWYLLKFCAGHASESDSSTIVEPPPASA